MSGDIGSIISPSFNLKTDSCLRFDVRMNAVVLDLGLARAESPWMKRPICTMESPQREKWQTAYIDLTAEPGIKAVIFSVVFNPEAHRKTTHMHIDNITLFTSTCEDFLPIGRYIYKKK